MDQLRRSPVCSKRFGGKKGQASLFGGRVDRMGSQPSMALTINKE
jgi:hypothetical protein